MRRFWEMEFPVGDPLQGPAYGERRDPRILAGANSAAGAFGGFSSIVSAIGDLSRGAAARRAGKDAQAAAEFEAAQMNQAAGQVVASAQRVALEERRKARLVMSRGLAVAAASGAGASDPTVVNLLADIEGEGSYRAGMAMYEGEERARQLRMGAAAKRYEGALSARAGLDRQRAFGLSAAGSLFSKYGQGGPKKPGAASGFSEGTGEDTPAGGYYTSDEYPYAWTTPSRI